MQIKASLRSVLTEDDEELEIVPHVKGSTDFEVYESVVIQPRETVLAWDSNKKPVYELTYKVRRGTFCAYSSTLYAEGSLFIIHHVVHTLLSTLQARGITLEAHSRLKGY